MEFKILVVLGLIVFSLYFLSKLGRTGETEAEFKDHKNPLDDLVTRKPSRHAVFLDFDGVLHPGFSGTFAYRETFENIMREYPHVDIVISSSWRLNAPLDYLQSYFSEDIAQRVVGKTPDMSGTHTRHGEIELFAQYFDIEEWVVLDDEKGLFPDFYEKLVLMERHEGISGAGALKVRTRFAEVFA
jgi:hypothetical protein